MKKRLPPRGNYDDTHAHTYTAVNDKRYYITPRLWSRVLIRKTQKPVANVPLTIAEHIECRLALADYFFERRGPSL